ncbi:MAG: cytochrome ubiquinol oxidase subunit I [Anaerolineales bacterium]|nr:cytochrome ubiquinol oxidase subunit I [Anaerolineales bacterium]
MDPLILARWQFAIVTIYHFFYVPLTLGLSIFVAILETKYVRSGDEMYKKMAKFWGKIFLINFAIGVVTGIVQEFQFGMNWSEYSRFMGDIFGAPLAIEALLAFYMESTFIGLWIFGWDKLSKKMHLAAAWLVAIGSNISALWILIANSFMQHPQGYTIDPETGRALMSDFGALVFNPNVMLQFPHVLASGISLAGFVVMAFSAWHLLRKHDVTFFRPSFRMAAIYALVGAVLVGTIGHFQGQFLIEHQPLKMAAAEALWETEQPANFSVFAIIDEESQTNTVDITIPNMLSFLSYNNFTGEVEGIKDLAAQAEAEYGTGDYIPPVALNYWSFRIMVGAGSLMILIALLGVLWSKDRSLDDKTLYLKAVVFSAALPYLAVSTGWILAETGRWPWIVYGLQKIEDAVSPNVPAWNVAFSLALMIVLYTVFTIVAYKLAVKYGTGDVKIRDNASAAD